MPDVSGYRLRLFLSVDLAGASAFKAGAGRDPASPSSPHPRWIVAIRRFYDAFPALLESHFHARKREFEPCCWSASSPRPWKTIGDEIVFCCRLRDADHLDTCMQAFIRSLREYGATLAANGFKLDVKGTGWVAAFPALNATATRTKLDAVDYLLEEFEARADDAPSDYDFLGPDIDAGFRVAKHAAPDRCALSVQLAWLLTRHAGGPWSSESFVYAGRDRLRGVTRDEPYPVICLDTERNPRRTRLRQTETRIVGQVKCGVDDLHQFSGLFMETEGMELPFLPSGRHPAARDALPASYEQFRRQAGKELQDIIRQDQQLSASGDAGNDAVQEEIPAAVTQAARQTTSDQRSQTHKDV